MKTALTLPLILFILLPVAVAQTETKDIGTWVVNQYGITITTTLHEKSGQPYMRQRYDDGSELEDKLTKRGNRYYLPTGEWFVITSTGRLNLYDSDGLIWSARPV